MSASLAEFVRDRRVAAGMTREQLAVRSGLSFSSVQLIETGHRRTPYAATAAKLSRALGVTTDELIASAGNL